MTIHARILLLGAAVASLACSSSKDCTVGTDGCTCTSGGACDPGLTCSADVAGEPLCLAPGAGGGARGGNHRDDFVGLYSTGQLGEYGYLYNDFALFGPGRRVVFAKPLWRDDGSFDFDATAAKHPTWVGSHRIEGEELVVVWDDGSKDSRYRVSRNNRGDLTFRKGYAFAPAYPNMVTQLRGRFVSKSSSSLGTPSSSYGTPSTTVSTWSSLKFDFSHDGTFTYDKSGGAMGTTTVGGATGPTTVGSMTSTTGGQSKGSYRIAGVFMILTFEDGTSAQDIFEPEPKDADPNTGGFYWGTRYYDPPR